MENEILVEVKGLSKKFSRDLKLSLWYGLKEIVTTMFGLKENKSRLRKEEFWAVKDVNFQLRRGECLGLIGHNGAGKSTLLKMLNGLIRPDEGSIIMRGKIGALIELGAGFNPILTGRENVYINGQLIGFSKKEIDEKLDAILEFADIGEFINSPVQNYSSGMKVRLGFAIAAQMEPDILIIDEVLAVGDVGFRIKCYSRIIELIRKSAVILVSHSMPSIGRVCTSAILMNKGKLEFQSDHIHAVVEKYNQHFYSESASRLDSFTKTVELKKVFFNGSSDTRQTLEFGSMLVIDMELFFKAPMDNVLVSLVFIDQEEKIIASTRSGHIHAAPGLQLATFNMLSQFTTGEYSLHVVISQKEDQLYNTLVRMGNAFRFSVTNCLVINASPILLPNEFTVQIKD